jgi:CBS domain-containing protein
VGVISKTDLICAYYAMLSKESAAGDLVAAEPVTCFPDDMLEDAIDLMQANGIHRLYVRGAELGAIDGTLAYIDVVGLLYACCRTCRKSTAKARAAGGADDAQRLLVGDVMSRSVVSCREDASLNDVIERLNEHACGAVLVEDGDGWAVGVISKTDLVLAYRHGRSTGTPARDIMHAPVRSSTAGAPLAQALQEMLVRDIQRLFIRGDDPRKMAGVLSLSDSARFRSGSCRACLSGRLMVEG